MSLKIQDGGHCWHPQGLGWTNALGAHWKEVCCWCGGGRTASTAEEVVDGHGPYASVKRNVTRYDGGDYTCPHVLGVGAARTTGDQG